MQGRQVEGILLVALDRETDVSIASQLQATLRTLLAAGAPTQPAHWLATFSSVALASGPTIGAAAAAGGAGGPRAGGADLDQGLMTDAGRCT